METFTIVVAFLAIAASLVALYLVGDTAKRVEEETKAVVSTHLRPLTKTMEQTARAVLALEKKQEEMAKALVAMTSQVEEDTKRVKHLSESMDKAKGALTMLERKIPGKLRDPHDQSRPVQ